MKASALFLFCISTLVLNTQNIPSLEWKARLSGSSETYLKKICVDPWGNSYTAGTFSGTVDFDPGPGVFTLTASEQDVFCCKLNPDGKFIWAISISSPGMDWINNIAVDTVGDLYAVGEFTGTTDFDPGAGTYTISCAGSTDAYILKLHSSGSFLWAKSIAGPVDDRLQSVCIDSKGRICIAGNFSGTVDLDPGPGQSLITSIGTVDMFVARLDPSGSLIWVKQQGGITGSANPAGMYLDDQDALYTVGNFAGTITFDVPTNTNLTPGSFFDSFILRHDSSGNLQVAENFGGTGVAFIEDVYVDAERNMYIYGGFTGNIDFDPGPGSATKTHSAFGYYIQKLNSSANLIWVLAEEGGMNSFCHGVRVDNAGAVYACGIFTTPIDLDHGNGTFMLSPLGVFDNFLVRYDSTGNFDWAAQQGGNQSSVAGMSMDMDRQGALYTTGLFEGVIDFDPGSDSDTFSTQQVGLSDIYVNKLVNCFSEAPLVLGPTVICAPGVATLQAANSGTSTISWYTTSTSTIAAGTGTQFITPTLTAGVNLFFVGSSHCDGHFARTAISVSAVVCQGLERPELHYFTFFPNPASSSFMISEKQISGPIGITIFNVVGEQLHKTTISDSRVPVAVEFLPAGIYLVQLLDNRSEIHIGYLLKTE